MHRLREGGPKIRGLMVFSESTGGEVWLGTWGIRLGVDGGGEY